MKGNKMRKYVALILLVFIVSTCIGASIQSLNMAWEEFISGITETTSTPGVTARKWASIPNALKWENDESKNNIEIAVISNADGQTATYEVWAARQSGDMVLIYTSSVTTGQQTATNGGFYVDTASTTWNIANNYEELDYGGNNRMTRWWLDARGYRCFIIYFTTISAGEWRVIVSGV